MEKLIFKIVNIVGSFFFWQIMKNGDFLQLVATLEFSWPKTTENVNNYWTISNDSQRGRIALQTWRGVHMYHWPRQQQVCSPSLLSMPQLGSTHQYHRVHQVQPSFLPRNKEFNVILLTEECRFDRHAIYYTISASDRKQICNKYYRCTRKVVFICACFFKIKDGIVDSMIWLIAVSMDI